MPSHESLFLVFVLIVGPLLCAIAVMVLPTDEEDPDD